LGDALATTAHWVSANHMFFRSDEKVALFIDGMNLHSAARRLGLNVDFRKLRDFFHQKSRLVRAYYYTALNPEDSDDPMKPLTVWLDYNGYTVVTKPSQGLRDPNERLLRSRGSISVEMAVDMLELVPQIDHAVLFAGSSDYRRLVEAVQRRGVRVSAVSANRTNPPMIADELRRQADQFIELADIGPEICRRPIEPTAAETASTGQHGADHDEHLASQVALACQTPPP
jgi:uncharacterized LabA/DUF88 family protein